VVLGEPLLLVIDTGFEGDLVLPVALASRLCGPATGVRVRRLADGSRRDIPVHEVELSWHGADRLTEVLALGDEPLVGTALMEGHHLHVEIIEGGEVLVEPM